MKIAQTLLTTAVLLAVTGVAQAALFDRGNGMIYDSALNITWLQDANYAQTSGYDADGKMNWADANAWAAQLVYQGFSDWRLTSVGNTPASGYLNTGELGYMFYNNLGNTAGTSILGNVSFTDATPGGGTENFLNVQSLIYWNTEAYVGTSAWAFDANTGFQGFGYNGNVWSSWAVRDGDVSSVPVPGALWLLGSGLLGLAGLARRRKAV